jgi:hypothetical protein
LSFHGLSIHVTEFWRGIIQTVSWAIALAWVLRTYDAVHLLPTLPDLTTVDWDAAPAGSPTLTVVVPARD